MQSWTCDQQAADTPYWHKLGTYHASHEHTRLDGGQQAGGTQF